MANYLLNINISTGSQVFDDEAEYTAFLDGLLTPGSPMEQITQHIGALRASGDLIAQKHHKSTSSPSIFIISKVFASEEAALTYKFWLEVGPGKSLMAQWMQPLGWSFTQMIHRALSDSEFEAIAATL